MCLALPVRVIELLPDSMALVDLGGIRKAISLALAPSIRECSRVLPMKPVTIIRTHCRAK